MLFIGIPAFDEAPTIGVLLWKIRQVFATFSREFEIVVYDDGSTDATAETLEPYTRVLPLTLIRGTQRLGYAGALDQLLRAVSARSRYPRRDALITMQADFTDQPEHLRDLVKRFEGGADLVVGERDRENGSARPPPVRRLQRVAPWVLRPFVAVPGVRDPFGVFRLYRVALVRDLLKAAGDSPVVRGAGWGGGTNVDLLLRALPLARRMETVSLTPRYDLRPRASRVRPLADALSLYRFARTVRRPRVAPPPPPDKPRPSTPRPPASLP